MCPVPQSESFVLLTTFCGTLFFEIEFAIYAGVFLSLAVYLTRTAHPHVIVMAPDPLDQRRRLVEAEKSDLLECPQLKIIRIDGSLFFGAAEHVSERIEEIDSDSPKHLLIVGHGISYIDLSGAMVLTQEAKRREKINKRLYLCRISRDIYHFLEHGDFTNDIQKSRFFHTEYVAISKIFTELEYSVRSACTARIFKECQTIGEPDTP